MAKQDARDARRAADRRTPDQGTPRIQRVLATMAFGLIGISALAVIALLVLHATGVPGSEFSRGGLFVLTLLPLPGLTLGLLLVIATIVLTAVRRARS